MRWGRAAAAAAVISIVAWWWVRPAAAPGKHGAAAPTRVHATWHPPTVGAPPIQPPAAAPETPLQPARPLRPSLRGVVVDARTGAVLAGAAVELCSLPPSSGTGGCPVEPGPLAAVTTGPDGAFALVLPEPVPLALVARADGHTRAVLDGSQLAVEGGAELTVALEPLAHVFGRVLEPDGTPVAFAVVDWSVGPEPGPHEGRNVVDEQGAYDLPGLPATDLLLFARTGAEKLVLVPVSLRGGEERALDLVLEPQRVFHIRGRLVDRSGRPLMMAEVGVRSGSAALSRLDRLLLQEQDRGSVQTDIDGEFTLSFVSPGPYQVAFYSQTGRDLPGAPIAEVQLLATPEPSDGEEAPEIPPVTVVARDAPVVICTALGPHGAAEPLSGFRYAATLGSQEGGGGVIGLSTSVSVGTPLEEARILWPAQATELSIVLETVAGRTAAATLHGPTDPCRIVLAGGQ